MLLVAMRTIGGNLNTFYTHLQRVAVHTAQPCGSHAGILPFPYPNSRALFIFTSGPGIITSGWLCAYFLGTYPVVFLSMKLRQMSKTSDFKDLS